MVLREGGLRAVVAATSVARQRNPRSRTQTPPLRGRWLPVHLPGQEDVAALVVVVGAGHAAPEDSAGGQQQGGERVAAVHRGEGHLPAGVLVRAGGVERPARGEERRVGGEDD